MKIFTFQQFFMTLSKGRQHLELSFSIILTILLVPIQFLTTAIYYNSQKTTRKKTQPAMNIQINSLIEALLSADNLKRNQAQKIIDQLPATHFNEGIDALLSTLGNPNQSVASMGALLLKKKYIDEKTYFSQISGEKIQLIVKTVQNSMGADKQLLFMRRCCDILVKVYVFINRTRELIFLIQTLAANQCQNIKLIMMYLIQIICESAFDDQLLMEYSGALEQIFQAGMQSQSNQLRVTSFKTLCIFLSSINDPNLIKKFEGVLQLLLNKAIELIKYDQQSGVIAVQSINQLVETHPKFIKPIFKEMLMIYTEIMQTPALLVKLRSSSMYGILSLAQSHGSLMRKNEYFKTNMVPAYMKMLAEIESKSEQQWSQQLNQEIISNDEIAKSTEQHISQLSMELGNKFMLPLFTPYIQKALTSQEINSQHAGLTAMSVLIEGCHESFKKELSNIMSLVVPLIQTSNPKIVYDILVAFGYMSEEFAPEIQTNYGDLILQFICKALEHPYPKVKYIAVKSIVNFETGIKQNKQITIMEKYMENILASLGKIFEASLTKLNCFMLEAVMDTLAIIASQNSFAKYYSTFMPGLKKTLSLINDDTAQKVMIKSKTIQTMGFLLSSVKQTKELFLPDCKQIMDSLINMTANLDKDDPLHKATFIVYQNVVDCLKQDFAVYADYVVGRTLEAVNKKIDFSIVDEGQQQKQTNKKNQYIKLKVDLKIEGLKNIVLNTDNIEQKMQAANLLECLAEDMGTAYGPYIEKTIPTISELISFKHNKQIRGNMIRTCKHILNDCVNEQQKTFVLNSVLPPMLQELTTVIRTKDHQELNDISEVLAEMMPSMNMEMKNKMPEVLLTMLSAVKNLTKQVQKVYADKEMDEELQQEMDDQIAQVEQPLQEVEKMIRIGATIPELSAKYIELKKYFPEQYQFQSN